MLKRILLIVAVSLCTLCAAALCACIAPPSTEPGPNAPATDESDGLIVRFIDVGQGDAALISCSGHHMLIDGGSSDASRKIYAILQTLDIDWLDAIVATHSDADHIGGISGALNYAGAGACFCSVTEADSKTFASMKRYLEKAGCPIMVPDPGDSFSLGGATVTFVGPTRAFEDDNNTSVVCRIDYGQTSVLFTGDAERESEQAMIDDGANLSATLLKVAHHGSGSSTSEAFLQTVHPSYAVISVGEGNDWGHPHQSVLDRLAHHNVAIWRTDIEGSIIATSDGHAFEFETVTMIER